MSDNESSRLYTKMYLDFIESKAFSDLSGNALKLYLRLRRYVCRARSNHSLSDFYIKGSLAVSGYLGQYADSFGVHKSSISRWLRELEEAKFLVTYQVAVKNTGKPNIWILGRVMHIEGSKYGIDIFFADHDAMSQEPDDRAAQIFDQSKGETVTAGMKASSKAADLLTVAPTVAPVQQSAQRSAQRSNRKDLIDKTNNPPAKERGEEYPIKEEQWINTSPKEERYVSLDESGYPTKTLHPLIEFIHGKKRHLTDNQQDSLSWGVPKHNPEYPAPTHLWDTNPLFESYIINKIDWVNGAFGKGRKSTGRLVTAICNYNAEKFGWFDWLQEHEEQVGETTHTVMEHPEVETPKLTPEEFVDAMAQMGGVVVEGENDAI